MAPRGVVCGFEDVHKLLEVGIVCARLTIGLEKLLESEGSSVLLVWVADVAIEGCEEGGEASKEDLDDFLTAVVRGFAKVDSYCLLHLTC